MTLASPPPSQRTPWKRPAGGSSHKAGTKAQRITALEGEGRALRLRMPVNTIRHLGTRSDMLIKNSCQNGKIFWVSARILPDSPFAFEKNTSKFVACKS